MEGWDGWEGGGRGGEPPPPDGGEISTGAGCELPVEPGPGTIVWPTAGKKKKQTETVTYIHTNVFSSLHFNLAENEAKYFRLNLFSNFVSFSSVHTSASSFENASENASVSSTLLKEVPKEC